jgi:hypothetical protein
MTLERGFHRVDDADLAQIEDEAKRTGALVVRLTGERIRNKKDFFKAFEAVLDLNPPLVLYNSWDGWSDSTFEAITELEPDRVVVIIWTHTAHLRAISLRDHGNAEFSLRELAGKLANERVTAGATRTVCVYVTP